MEGRTLKLLYVVDEHSCACLAIRVDRRCQALDEMEIIERSFLIFIPHRLISAWKPALGSLPMLCNSGAQTNYRQWYTTSQLHPGITHVSNHMSSTRLRLQRQTNG